MFEIWRRDEDGLSGYEALRKAANADVDVVQGWVDDSFVVAIEVEEYGEEAAEIVDFATKSPYEYAAVGSADDVERPDSWESGDCKIRVKKHGDGSWMEPELVGDTELDLVALSLPREDSPEWW